MECGRNDKTVSNDAGEMPSTCCGSCGMKLWKERVTTRRLGQDVGRSGQNRRSGPFVSNRTDTFSASGPSRGRGTERVR